MIEAETLSLKQAAIEAQVHGAQIFVAIKRGSLRVRRLNSHTLVIQEGFNAWRRLLESGAQSVKRR